MVSSLAPQDTMEPKAFADGIKKLVMLDSKIEKVDEALARLSSFSLQV